MDRLELPATAGLLAAIATVIAVLVPYPTIGSGAVATYYEYGLLGGWSVLVLAVVAAVVFASARQRRADPATSAGAGLVLGIAATALAAYWALAVPYGVIGQFEVDPSFRWHRWALLATSSAIAVAGLWYSSAQDLF